MRSKVGCEIGLVLALVAALPLQAQKIEYTIRSEDQIAGRGVAKE